MSIGLTRDEYEEEHREKDERIAELERRLTVLWEYLGDWDEWQDFIDRDCPEIKGWFTDDGEVR